MAEVNLTSGIKRNLMSLQQTSRLFEDTQNNLASGRKVNTPLDSPTNWFRAENLIDRARGLEFRYDDMGQAIQTVKAADLGLSSIRSLLDTLRGVVNDALTTTESSDRRALGQQFNELLRQTANVAKASTSSEVTPKTAAPIWS